MKKGSEELKSSDELLFERDNSERAKIGLPESIIVLSVALFADFVEIVTGIAEAIPVVGTAIDVLGNSFGYLMSGFLFIWALMRGIHGQFFVRKLAIYTTAALFDAVIPYLPTRSVALAAVIFLNNRVESKTIDRIIRVLEGRL